MVARCVVCVMTVLLSASAVFADWSEDQIRSLPAGEMPIHLFNGRDFTGWEGYTGKYFFVEEGLIIGRNTDQNAPKSSTYLLTTKTYRNFRLIFESKLVTSEMHSGISLWGKAVTKDEGPFTYQGHLVMYPSAYGYHDLFRRNNVFKDTLGIAQMVGKQHEWNRMEILAIGHRIRHVVNGQLVADWSDPQPELCEEGPLGLQLHSNKVAQEVQWRGLILTENPQNRLVTATNRDAGLVREGTAAESGMNSDVLKKIGPRMQELIEAKQAAGIVTLVARRGRVVHISTHGKADMASGREMTKDTLFAIASMTKPITAAGVMIAVDDGKLKLDDPISKYIPAFKNTKVKGGTTPNREITVRDCLRHTSGLQSDQQNTGTLEETADKLAASELGCEPGSKWIYGPGLSVAGRVLEVATKMPYDQYLQQRIFRPLEMMDTSFRPTDEQKQRLALLYQPTADKQNLEPGQHWLFDKATTSVPNPSGGLYSTIGDLIRFYQMILNGGSLNAKRVLSSAAVIEMSSLQTGEMFMVAPGVGWGLGFSVIQESSGTNISFLPGSYGHSGAFGTQGWIDPERELITILLVARQNFMGPEAIDLRAELQRLAVEAITD